MRGVAYHLPAGRMYILRDVLVNSEHRAPNAEEAYPEPLRRQPPPLKPMWLVTRDNRCGQAAKQAQLWTESVVVQLAAGQPRSRGLPRGTSLLVAMVVPHDPRMALDALEDQP